ncbi:uncharacterized protein [Ptychodera flava]|uniref:uncharacterized protein n=1 Tax=Ptychodera flava TaxID=63121 RepID=UPI00396A4BD1
MPGTVMFAGILLYMALILPMTCGVIHAPARWRDDLRCGNEFPMDDEENTESECDPYSQYPCCSAYGWCGSSSSHCECAGCIDYRKVVRWRNDRRCGKGFPSPNTYIGECDPDSAHPCCSYYGWCGNDGSHCDCLTCVDYRTESLRLDKITVTMVTPTTIGISWRSPLQLLNPEDHFVLTLDPPDGNSDFPLHIPANTTEYLCQDLVPNTEYNISLIIPTQVPIMANYTQKTGENPCAESPCENSGTCRAVVGKLSAYTCQCQPCYEGPHCEIAIDACASNPCQNHGTCTSDAATCTEYTCECLNCYIGRNCETYIDPCESSPCKNDTAVCQPMQHLDSCYNYKCLCNDSVRGCFVGDYCQQHYDPCVPNPCRPGQCERGKGFCSAICHCPDCFTGTHCETLLDPCRSNPCNGGRCVQQGRSCHQFYCQCPECYTGKSCETYIDDACAMYNPCRNNGTCLSSNHSCLDYQCQCPECYHGDICQSRINPCDTADCQNDGVCVPSNDSCVEYTCRCGHCYTGDNCEQFESICDTNPCMNGGICIPDGEDCSLYVCECSGPWFWTNCVWHISSVIIACQVILLMVLILAVVLCKRKGYVKRVMWPRRLQRQSPEDNVVHRGDRHRAASDDVFTREATEPGRSLSVVDPREDSADVTAVSSSTTGNENEGKTPTCQVIAKAFFESTTWHGLPRISQTPYRSRKLFWTVLFLTSCTLLFIQLQAVIARFWSFPINIKVEEVARSSVSFPAVTVCNTNKLRSSALAKSRYSPLVEVMKDAKVYPYYVPCLGGDFLCNDGIDCIKSYGVCDGIPNCPDGSDELHCDHTLVTCDPVTQFKCNRGGLRGVCIKMENRCDGIKDCLDGADEDPQICDYSSRGGESDDDTCLSGFKCDHGICHPNIHLCNHVQDCVDGSDETDCTQRKCQAWEYQCKNKRCIQSYKECNWVDDCGDGSDETACDYRGCTEDEFRCDMGQCIAKWKVCNSHVDCRDKSDEKQNCTNIYCVDEYENCDIWARQGECEQNPLFMTARCRLSCGTCVGEQVIAQNGACPAGYFRCTSGHCIENIQFCNNERECNNGEDEDWPRCIYTESSNLTSAFNDGWYERYTNITDRFVNFTEFRQYYYSDPGFDRVPREEPAAWKTFMSFSSTPDFSDLTNVLKVTGEEIAEYGHQAEDFILQCSFNGAPCSHRDFIARPNDVFGNCFIFNYDREKQKQSTRSGSGSGLSLTLFTEQDEYLGLFGQESGVRVSIHQPLERPYPERDGLTSKTGAVTSFAIRKAETIRIGDPYGECKPEMSDEYFYIYSKAECESECLKRFMLEYCSCYDTFIGSPRCMVLNKTQEACRQLIHYLHETSRLPCNCLLSCHEITFTKTISQSTWPSEKYLSQLLKNLHAINPKTKTVTELQGAMQNLVKVEVYYESLTVAIVTEEPAYDREDLTSDIGGLLGLYIGISAITLFESLEFFIDVFRLFVRKIIIRIQRMKH